MGSLWGLWPISPSPPARRTQTPRPYPVCPPEAGPQAPTASPGLPGAPGLITEFTKGQRPSCRHIHAPVPAELSLPGIPSPEKASVPPHAQVSEWGPQIAEISGNQRGLESGRSLSRESGACRVWLHKPPLGISSVSVIRVLLAALLVPRDAGRRTWGRERCPHVTAFPGKPTPHLSTGQMGAWGLPTAHPGHLALSLWPVGTCIGNQLLRLCPPAQHRPFPPPRRPPFPSNHSHPLLEYGRETAPLQMPHPPPCAPHAGPDRRWATIWSQDLSSNPSSDAP